MTGNLQERLQLAIPISQQPRRVYSKQPLPLSDGYCAWFPVSLKTTLSKFLTGMEEAAEI